MKETKGADGMGQVANLQDGTSVSNMPGLQTSAYNTAQLHTSSQFGQQSTMGVNPAINHPYFNPAFRDQYYQQQEIYKQ